VLYVLSAAASKRPVPRKLLCWSFGYGDVQGSPAGWRWCAVGDLYAVEMRDESFWGECGRVASTQQRWWGREFDAKWTGLKSSGYPADSLFRTWHPITHRFTKEF
jgi:hypothetical protein